MRKSGLITGIATNWNAFTAQSGRVVRYEQSAFFSWLRSGAPQICRLQLRHEHDLQRAGLMTWEATATGLRVGFRLDLDHRLSRGAALAIEHGWLRGLSLCADLPGRTFDQVDGGTVCVVRKASPDELSLTPTPACPGALIHSVDGHDLPRTKSWPSDPAARADLAAFLTTAAITIPAGVRTAATPKPTLQRQRFQMPTTAAGKDRLARLEAAINSGDPRIRIAAWKELTPAEHEAAIDSILDAAEELAQKKW